jgi:hypothetical protein
VVALTGARCDGLSCMPDVRDRPRTCSAFPTDSARITRPSQSSGASALARNGCPLPRPLSRWLAPFTCPQSGVPGSHQGCRRGQPAVSRHPARIPGPGTCRVRRVRSSACARARPHLRRGLIYNGPPTRAARCVLGRALRAAHQALARVPPAGVAATNATAAAEAGCAVARGDQEGPASRGRARHARPPTGPPAVREDRREPATPQY